LEGEKKELLQEKKERGTANEMTREFPRKRRKRLGFYLKPAREGKAPNSKERKMVEGGARSRDEHPETISKISLLQLQFSETKAAGSIHRVKRKRYEKREERL